MSLPSLKSDEVLEDTVEFNDLDTFLGSTSTSSTEILDKSWDIVNECEATLPYFSSDDSDYVDIEENPRKRKLSDLDDEVSVKRRCPNKENGGSSLGNISNDTMDIVTNGDIDTSLFVKPNLENWTASMNQPYVRVNDDEERMVFPESNWHCVNGVMKKKEAQEVPVGTFEYKVKPIVFKRNHK